MSNLDECLNVSQKAKGVIPSKVSELENDIGYLTKEVLEKVIVANQVGEYTGLEDKDVKVIVDNLYKTIRVELLKTAEDDLKTLLPKVDGNYKDGNYVLKVLVSNGSPVFGFLEESNLLLTNYYYGNVSVEGKDLTEGDIKLLSNGGSVKEDKQFTYNTYKQYQVFAYPASFGVLSSIEHVQTGFNVTELFSKFELVVNDLKYYAYVSESRSTGEYTYKFNY